MSVVGVGVGALSKAWTRRVAVGVFALASVGSVLLVLRSPVADQLADLRVYWGSVRWAAAGLPLYDFRAANGDPFTYPPFAALLMAPLGRLPFVAVGAVWTAASLAAIVALGHVVARRGLDLVASAGRTAGWVIAAAVLVSAPGQSDIHFGQVTLFLVLACLADGLGVTPARWRGVLIGLAAAVKLTPLLFIALLVVTGQRRTALRATAAFAAATGLGWLVMPQASTRFWTEAVFATDRIGDITALGNQSLNGALMRAGLPTGITHVLWVVLAGALVLAALWRARQLHRAGEGGRAVVLIGCATVAASPVSWTHHQFWTLLAGILMLAATGRTRRVAGAVVVVLMTVNVGSLLAVGDQPAPGTQYLADNVRALLACLLCTTSLLAATELQPERKVLAGPMTRRASAAVAAVAAVTVILFAVLPLPTRGATHVVVAPIGAAGNEDSVDDSVCAPEAQCRVGGALGPVNYGASWTPDGVEVAGLTSTTVARLEYLPAPGRRPYVLHLDPTRHHDFAFAFTAGDTSFGQLLAYDAEGRLLGEYGRKLREG